MADEGAVESLKQLGLSTYEARVFTALVRLGSGTARDVASVTDVPRSQVYATADDLEARGFISIRQSNPQVFRPVSLDEARAQLERRFEGHCNAAFDRLSTLERTAEGDDEQSEAVWSMTGTTAVTERVGRLADEAETVVLYGAAELDDPDPDLLAAFAALCDRGVTVGLLPEHDQPVADVWTDLDCVRTFRLPAEQTNEYAERVLVVDFETFLLSIQGPDAAEETAVWSARTTFAQVFSRLIVGSFPGAEDALDGPS
ncbi:MAG: TrmB family transcriptional regulator [Haloferacaceae archaeon]